MVMFQWLIILIIILSIYHEIAVSYSLLLFRKIGILNSYANNPLTSTIQTSLQFISSHIRRSTDSTISLYASKRNKNAPGFKSKNKGKKPWNYGRKHSNETKAKISKAVQAIVSQ